MANKKGNFKLTNFDGNLKKGREQKTHIFSCADTKAYTHTHIFRYIYIYISEILASEFA